MSFLFVLFLLKGASASFGVKFIFYTLLLFGVADFICEDEASRCCKFNDRKNCRRFFPIYQH